MINQFFFLFHKVSRLDGTYRTVVISSDYTNRPKAITVYPAKGLLFWTDYDMNTHRPRIHRSAMDGSDHQIYPLHAGEEGAGISIDYEEDKVYYVQDSLDAMWRMDLDGGKNLLFFFHLWFRKWRR